jgi:protein-L-isoaspartate(D-aspartate) O-methyltransferase
MAEALQLTATDKVLEVGSGSGYASAVLAEIAAQVFSVERHAALATSARNVLTSLGYTNVTIFAADGTLGLSHAAPFDAILVSAASATVPVALLAQLRDGGRMIIPVGTDDSQQLQFVRVIGGRPVITLHELVRFVPLVHDSHELA